MATLLPRASGAISSVISGVNPVAVSTVDPLRLFLIQACIIIILSRILAFFLAKIKQPSVIAEVIAGILLGPTVFGRIPGFTDNIFPKASLPYLNLVANLGLLLFLFLVGLEVDVRIIRKCALSSTMISLSGLAIPFGFGAALSYGIFKDFIDTTKVSYGHFLLFTGVAMSITALPVLARIVLDLKLMQTTVGNVVLAAGVANDVVGWILLALAIALVNAGDGLTALYIFLVVVGWTLFLFFLVKPAIYWMARKDGSLVNGPSRSMIFIILLIVLISGFLTDIIGVQAIFGGFLVGLIIPHENGFAVALTEKIEDVVTVIFLPLFFTLSGLQTNLGTLNSGLIWGYTIAICIVAFTSKFLGCAIPAKLTGFSLRESAAIGTLMSCKGLVELIVLNIGLSAGILNTRVFSMFVVMALVTTCATTPLTQLIYPPKYRKMLPSEGEKAKKRDDDADDDGEKEGDVSGDVITGGSRISSKKFLVVLERFEHLPGLLGLLQLLKPTMRTANSIDNEEASSQLRHRIQDTSSHEKTGSSEKDVESSQHHSSFAGNNVPILLKTTRKKTPTLIDALRLVELTERTSAVMRVAETDDTLRVDPLINVFRTFANLNQLPIKASMSVVGLDEFSSVIVNRAKEEDSNLIVVPWTLPTNKKSESGIAANTFLNPLESFFGSGTDGNDEVSRYQQAAFVRKIIQSSPCDVGLLLDHKSDAARASGFYPHIIVGFMGGPDDRCALSLALRICRGNQDVKVDVYRFKKIEGAEEIKSPQNTFHHSDTLQASHSNARAAGIQDTMYPQSSGFTPLQAQLEDDLAIRNIEEKINGQEIGQRFVLHECETATPLQYMISLLEKNRETSLIILGRNRRMPTITHRAELRAILAPTISINDSNAASEKEEKILNSEICTVVGEAGIAVSRMCTLQAPTLIIASALSSSTRWEEV